MRHPWLADSNDAELEALQTDVMRFVAILGLCLAAIFSLVQRASLEQPPPLIELATPLQADLPAILKPDWTPQAPPQAQPKSTPARAPESAIPPAPQESQTGFSLEFASAADLMALLETGQLQLYAELDGQFWLADRRGRFAVAEAPSSYYRMQSSTVPEALAGSLRLSAKSGNAIWGVVLAQPIIEQMTQLTSTHEGGNLLILGSGRVELEQLP